MLKKVFLVYGLLLCVLLTVSNIRGWYLLDLLHPTHWGSRHDGVYYHGTGGYHK